MGQRVMFFSDLSEKEAERVGRMEVQFSDGRRGRYELDITDEEAEEYAKKGRKITGRHEHE